MNGMCEVCGRGLETGEQREAHRCYVHIGVQTTERIYVNPLARPKARTGEVRMPQLLESDLGFYRLGTSTIHIGHVPEDWGETACGKKLHQVLKGPPAYDLVTQFDPRQSALCRVCKRWAEKRGALQTDD